MFPKNLGQDLAIFRKNNIIDVFNGKNGWENHSRFILHRTKAGTKLIQTAGDKVSPEIKRQIHNTLEQ